MKKQIRISEDIFILLLFLIVLFVALCGLQYYYIDLLFEMIEEQRHFIY